MRVGATLLLESGQLNPNAICCSKVKYMYDPEELDSFCLVTACCVALPNLGNFHGKHWFSHQVDLKDMYCSLMMF